MGKEEENKKQEVERAPRGVRFLIRLWGAIAALCKFILEFYMFLSIYI